jgi:hypothetical protein
MFIAVLFLVAKLWNQTRYPSTNEWIKKMTYIHNGVLFRHEEQKYVICRAKDGTGGHRVKQNKPDSYVDSRSK